MLRIIVTFLINLKLLLCDYILDSVIISDTEESFVLYNTEYIFINQRATWNLAEIICSSEKYEKLAIVNTKAKMDFLALALSELNMKVENVWIGGKLENCDSDYEHDQYDEQKSCFKWLGKKSVNTEYMLKRNKSRNITSRECLSLSRNYHDEPVLIDLQCKLLRPFICERPYSGVFGTKTHSGWINTKYYEYAVVYDEVNWKTAVVDCFTKFNAYLADFRNIEEIKIVAKALMKGRPSLENAWIGGRRTGTDFWYFLSNGQYIPNKKNPKTNFPPWYKRDNNFLPRGKCLTLDRHLSNDKWIEFLPIRCTKKNSYICSKKKNAPDKSKSTTIINNIEYTLFYEEMSWEEASLTCIDHKSWLVEVTQDKVDTVVLVMGENEIAHIWIGGKLDENNVWSWVKSNQIIPSNPNKDNYPPWLDSNFEQDYVCLNMDRENYNKVIFYGVFCRAKQRFICEKTIK